MFLQRFISSLVMGCLVVSTFFVPDSIFAIMVASLIFFGLREFYSMIEKKGICVYKHFGIAIGILVPFSIYFSFNPTPGWELALIVSACLLFFILQIARMATSQAVVSISTTLFGIFYVSWFFSFIIKIRMLGDGMIPDGNYLILYLLLVTKTGDIVAYLVGSKFGKHSLIPLISPKKSVEGAIGAFATSVLVSVFFKLVFVSVPVYHFIILGVLLGILAQIGDLSESLIKRDCNVKDSGKFMPGLGGALDIIDSLLFTTPVLYFYVKMLL